MKDFSVKIEVSQSPEQVFEAVTNVRAWWSENIEGRTDIAGSMFTFHHKDMHRSTHAITELVSGKHVVWDTRTASINFVKDSSEWDGTKVVVEIEPRGSKTELRFTHVGLRPTMECYEMCSRAWTFYVNESLKALIETGTGMPELREEAVTLKG